MCASHEIVEYREQLLVVAAFLQLPGFWEMRQCLTRGQMVSADLPLHTHTHTHTWIEHDYTARSVALH